MSFRIEKDFLGEKKIPQNVYYGIHTQRAVENFPVSGYKTEPVFIKALGLVKKASALTNKELGYLKDDVSGAILQSIDELIENQHDDQMVVDPLQGGAGTSANMNINEVIANRALELLGKEKGDYSYVSPLEHVNMHQSTNDVYPTAMKVAAIMLLKDLEAEIIELQVVLQEKEKEFDDVLKVGRTEMQDAVPLTLGKTFSAFADAIGRDRWRIFKCCERLRVVNLGGTMIGTGIAAPRDYIFMVTDKLREITRLNLSRGENLIDATQNHDVFVEVSGIMKAHAVTLRKIASDLRILSSGPRTGFGEINLKPLQAGSSIMPGKINPVIPEMMEQCVLKVIANDFIITESASRGELELNAFLPVLNFALLESLSILIKSVGIFTRKCIKHITSQKEVCRQNVENSFGVLTALLPVLGYEKVQEVAGRADKSGRPPIEIILESGLMSREDLDKILTPENFSKLGFDPPRKK